jgi:tRNA-guanine transglycosylase
LEHQRFQKKNFQEEMIDGLKRPRSPSPRSKDKKRKLVSSTGALSFEIVGSDVRARASILTLPHGEVFTPVFMPVGTYGAMKSVPAEDLERMGPQIILANTYHVGNRPGGDFLDSVGGLHNFMKWKRNMLTDSGGFQMVSLAKLLSLTEEGVEFESPVDHSKMLLTPELSMKIQNSIGADIMMVLDDVVSSLCEDRKRVKEATERTIRWLDRCIAAHKAPRTQNLFAIIQGGLDPELREWSLTETIKRDTPGFAIGGLSGGESKDQFWRVVSQCTYRLPTFKPRYVMGIGYTLDILCCVSLGADMFDCVYPTRTARFGTALVPGGQMRLTHSSFKNDIGVIDPHCKCRACGELKISRAYLHPIAGKESVAARLITEHNIVYMMTFMNNIRDSIKEGRFEEFVRDFLLTMFPKSDNMKPPRWVRNCLVDGAGLKSIEGLYDWNNAAIREGIDNPHVVSRNC